MHGKSQDKEHGSPTMPDGIGWQDLYTAPSRDFFFQFCDVAEVAIIHKMI